MAKFKMGKTDELLSTPGTEEFEKRQMLFEILRELTQKPDMDAFTGVLMCHSDGELQMSVLSMSLTPEKGPEMAMIGISLAQVIQEFLAAGGIEPLPEKKTH